MRAERAGTRTEPATVRTDAARLVAAQAELPQIYAWERSSALELNTVKWVRQIAADVAFPADVANVAQYVCDMDHLLIKNFPEFRCYRDIAFYLKFFLNPQLEAFPAKASYTQRQAQLTFYFHQDTFYVGGYGCPPQLLAARPRVKRGAHELSPHVS